MSEVLLDSFAHGSFAVSSRFGKPAPNHFAVFSKSLSTLHTGDNLESNVFPPFNA